MATVGTPETYDRPYNDLIDDETDKELFNRTFDGEKSDDDELDELKNETSKTGLIYHQDCVNHFCIWDDEYEENPKRFTRTLARLKELDLVSKCFQISARPATEQEILLCHSEEYVRKIEMTGSMFDPEHLEKESSRYDAVYFTPSTYDCARYAAGSAIELVKNVMEGKIQNGLALLRPPGHHAMRDEACGYCIFNNVAIAASVALEKYHLNRVLIVDWDVHHGQGTQRQFYRDDRVMYVSIHRYEHGSFWPELIESNYNFIGDGPGRGYNINVPLNETGICDTDFLAIWHNLLLPIFYQFDPELVLVSAGYDAAIGCPEGEMLLTPAVYGHLTHYLMALANGKLAVLMEGGYCVESLADGIAMTLRTLLGEPPRPLKMRYPIRESVVESVLDAISVLRSSWDILCLQRTFDRHAIDDGGEEQTEIRRRRRHFPMIDYQGTVDLVEEKPESYPTRQCYPVQTEEVRKKYHDAILALRNYHFEQSIDIDENRTCLITLPSDINRLHKAPETHPERPNRITFVWKFLEKANLLGRCYVIEDNRREATEDQLRLCHSQEALDTVNATVQFNKSKEFREYERQFDSIYLSRGSFQVAKTTVGALLQVVDCVLQNRCRNGMACIRPPGHHASRDRPAGFCLFNNVAIAARYALEHHRLKRIMIVDWDVHHGDGTQDIVSGDDRILFVSIHRYDHAGFYPETVAGNFTTPSKNVVNIGWNGGPMSDKEYLAAFLNVVLPIGYCFDPDLVLVSAGFDAARGDPLGGYTVSPETYGQMTHLLGSLANGRVILTLEGGYDLTTIAECTAECVRALLGNPPKRVEKLSDRPLEPTAAETLMDVIDYQTDRWPCFPFNVDIPESRI